MKKELFISGQISPPDSSKKKKSPPDNDPHSNVEIMCLSLSKT